MILRLIRFAIIAFTILPVGRASAQPEHNGYHVQQYTDEDGLPQNSISNILFDDNGFLWLASQLGLVRFDGNSFKVYDRTLLPAMESTRVRFLSSGANGDIYFQTEDNHLFLFGEKSNSLLASFNDSVAGKSLLLNDKKQVFDFTGFLSGHAPSGQQAKRAAIFDDLGKHNKDFYPTDSIHTYLSYNDSLYYFDGRQLLTLIRTAGAALNFLVLGKRLYVLKQREVICAFENGIKVLQRQEIEGDLVKTGKDPDRSGQAAGNDSRVFPGKTAHLLIGKKLYRVRETTGGKLAAEFLLDLGFLNNISDIEYNETLDILIISTETEGFYMVRKDKFRPSRFSGPLKDLLSGYLFGPMALNKKDGSILTSRFIFNAAGQYSVLGNLFPSKPKCLFLDHNNHVWSAIHNLVREYTPGFKQVKTYPAVDACVEDFTEDGEGTLYCLTDNSLWQLKGDSFQPLFHREQLSLKGPNESLSLAIPGKCWIANANGLIEYDLKTGKARLVPDIGDAHMRSIHKCRDGSVLLGSYGQGYYYYRRSRFYKMPLDKNDYLSTAHCFLEDDKGHVWISCNKGLFEISKPDLDSWCDSPENKGIYYYYYGRQDGLETNEFNGGFNDCGLITSDGFAVFLSMKGMVSFYADSLKPAFPTEMISISGIEVNGKSNPKKDSVKIDAGYNSLVVEVSCPFLGNRNNLYLQYCLDRPQKEWLDVPNDGKIKLNQLSPGDHTLRIRKINGFGVGNYSFKTLGIRIVPHFYQTDWFMILAALAALLFLVLFIQLRLNLIQKKKEVQVKAEKLRGTVNTLEETVEKLRESQRALLQTNKVREKLISLVIHDLRSPIRFLSLLANDLHDHINSFSEEEKKERTYWIKKGTNDIYNFSEDFLLWATSQKDNFNLVKRTFFIKPLLQEIHDFYREQVLLKGNTIRYEAPDELTLHSDPHILITIIRNLVDNANKYTEKGSITISANREAGQTVISIDDTGKGMSHEQINMFLKDDGLKNLKSGSQLGHKFVFDLAKRIDAGLSIESGYQKGTSVKLSFQAE
ncbi:MAG: ATP-binding protein [Puia sp.]|nr:ATP-binding protein [Puia sp.]